jgi:rhamnopyranosyl-N-acetylglucosaminyl-diphospho-decaprenol beta-1,3/1,4-galactofuranosyltransferase
MKILAAVVTYNRCALLKRCIDYIRAQTRPPDALLIINNSSPDDTVEMLDREQVDYVTQPNLGSAGGWARAIDEAAARGFDAVWLMDDDGYPDAAALGLLEASLAPGIGCVSSVVLRENQPSHFVFPFPRLNRGGYPALLARRRKVPTLKELRASAEGDLYPFAHLFNGALLKVGVAKTIGNVSSAYFMSGDEVDYYMRLQKNSRIYSHLGARHYHPDVTTRPLTPEKFYYYVKNTIILNKLYFDKKAARHLMAVAAALVRTARRNSLSTMLSYIAGRHAPVLWRAVTRGLTAQMGKDFDA